MSLKRHIHQVQVSSQTRYKDKAHIIYLNSTLNSTQDTSMDGAHRTKKTIARVHTQHVQKLKQMKQS